MTEPVPDTEPPRLPPEELKTLFLFESLDDDKLAWLSATGRVEERAAGTVVFAEGEDATCFFVLLEGTVSMHRQVEDTEVELVRTDHRGVYAGATQSFVRGLDATRYPSSFRAITDCTFWVVDASAFGERIREWFPMSMHLLEGLMLGMRNSQSVVAGRERLLSLGRLSAGLTHELNNPAAAAVRATSALRERVSKMRRKLAHLANADVDSEALVALTELQETAVERMVKAEKLSPVEVGDAEDALSDWLEDHDVEDAWDLAPALVAAGVTAEWLTEVADTVPAELLADGIHWVTYALETEQLMIEIEDSTDRISTLVNAAKQYSQVDRATYADIDVREGLRSTLTMLHYKIKSAGNITLVKELDEDLPSIPAHPAELNQVWTNLIDNAIQAMPGGGTLTVRATREKDAVVVEVADTGVGIPKAIQTQDLRALLHHQAGGRGHRAWDWTSPTGWSPNATAAICGCFRSPATPGSRCGCRWSGSPLRVGAWRH